MSGFTEESVNPDSSFRPEKEGAMRFGNGAASPLFPTGDERDDSLHGQFERQKGIEFFAVVRVFGSVFPVSSVPPPLSGRGRTGRCLFLPADIRGGGPSTRCGTRRPAECRIRVFRLRSSPSGSMSRKASARMRFRRIPFIWYETGSPMANSTTGRSRNGARTSSDIAMEARSVLTRMSSGR